MKETITPSARTKTRTLFPVLAAVVLALALAAPMCGDKVEGETPAQTAARLIKESLVLPDDAQYLEASVLLDQDRLIFQYGTKLTLEQLSDFMAGAVGGEILFKDDNAVGFRDAEDRVVNYAWFVRDPDLFPYRTAISVAVTPLPKAIKKDQKIE